MTYALFAEHDKNGLGAAIGRWLSKAEQQIIAARPKKVVPVVAHTRGEPQSVTTSPDHAKPQAERGSDPAKSSTTPKAAPPAALNLKMLADKQAARAAATAATTIRLSRLDTFLVFGKKIGDCTVAEVKTWAAEREKERMAAGRDARFALSLVANLPSGAVIRDYWKSGDDVDKMYDRAEAEYAA